VASLGSATLKTKETMVRMNLMVAAGLVAMATGSAVGAPKPAPTPRPDLADAAAGSYFGSVISDSRGAGQSDVTITVIKTAANTVSVSSSYPRLPTFTVRLTRAMQTIQQAGGGSTVFLLNLAKTPRHLDVTVDGASWSGDNE
jgi:hypothetical protein